MPQFEQTDGIDLEQDLNSTYLVKLCKLGQKKHFSRNEYIYIQGMTAKHVYILMDGTVKATCTDKNGVETLLKIHGPGSLLGLSALRPSAVRDANAVAFEDLETTCFNRDDFFQYIRNDGYLGVLLVRVLLKRQQELHARVSEFAGHSVEQRLARVLLQLYAQANYRNTSRSSPILHITHEELATLVVSRRQYVTAILRKFVSDDLIENKRSQIIVKNPTRLRQQILDKQAT